MRICERLRDKAAYTFTELKMTGVWGTVGLSVLTFQTDVCLIWGPLKIFTSWMNTVNATVMSIQAVEDQNFWLMAPRHCKMMYKATNSAWYREFYITVGY